MYKQHITPDVTTTEMILNTTRFLSLFFTALALGAGLAHLFELPNKINLSSNEYLIVQQIYRGWSLLGIIVVASFVTILITTVLIRHRKKSFALTLAALFCIVGTQVIFWIFTYPVNQQTKNWTVLPENWEQLRQQWEYSHATGAGLDLIALSMLILSLMVKEE